MSTNTGIEWCDHTWNPWQGCTKVSEGCKHCYMFRDMKRYGKTPDTVVRSSPATFFQPLKKHWKSGDKVFVCSWSDFFHEAADEWRAEAWEYMRERNDLRYIIVTKRIERAAQCLPDDWGNGWPNVALLASVENQKRADERIPILLNTPAAIRGISAEPLLGPIDLDSEGDGLHALRCEGGECSCVGLDWVIVGEESGGREARLMNIRWADSLQEKCEESGTPFFMKQLCNRGRKIPFWEFPFNLQIREFPKAWTNA